jgi:cytidylate kinase
MSEIIQIAVDGHSSCGKSTLARDLAKALNVMYIDSGAMYRAVSLYFLQNHISVNDRSRIEEELPKIHVSFKTENGHTRTVLNGEIVEKEIREAAVANIVSPVATIDLVREYLVAQQQDMGKHQSVVMDGRDIGTVVFPNADIKFFVTASIDVRAKRRWNELRQKGIPLALEDVRSNLISRDDIDSNRSHSPLSRAEDAILIDNTNLDRNQQLTFALGYVKKQLGKRKLN